MRLTIRAVKQAIERLYELENDLTILEDEEVSVAALRLAEWFVDNELIVDEDDLPGRDLLSRVHVYRQARRRAEERDEQS